jgi:hypothetical protein
MATRKPWKKEDHAAIRDFSDRELLGILADLSEANGGIGEEVDARVVASRVFGVTDNYKNKDLIAYLTLCVSSRFAWMRKYGMLEKGETKRHWVLSPMGNAMRTSRVPNPVAVAISSSEDSRMLALANLLGERMLRAGDVGAAAMRREFQFQVQRRKNLSRGA